MSPLVVIPLALGLVVVLLLVARLAGPVFVWEMVRMARRGRAVGVRALYGLAVLAALLVTYARWFPGQFTAERAFANGPTVEPSQSAQFAEAFAASFLLVQFAAVLLLTPAYVAGAIAEERQRRTLEFLCVSPLTRREIVLGKLAARMLHLGGALAVGLPVLSVTLLFGGVSPLRLVAGVVVTTWTFASLSALSILCSVGSRTVTRAVTAAYASAGFWIAITSCVPCVMWANPLVAMAVLVTSSLDADSMVEFTVLLGLGGFSVVHGILSAVLIRYAVRQLQAVPAAWRPSPGARLSPVDALMVPTESETPAAVRFFPLPPVGDRPLLWKERHFGANAGVGEVLHTGCTLAAVFLGALAVVTLAVACIEWSSGATVDIPYGLSINPVVRAVTVALLGGTSLAVGLLAAGSVTGEREARSLDALLTLPGDRVELLRAKWWGSLLRARLALGVIVFLWVMAVLTGALHPLALPLLATVGTAYVVFATSLGLYVSLVSRGTARANFLTGLVIVLNCLVPTLVVAVGASRTSADQGVMAIVEGGLTPPSVWWLLAFPRLESQGTVFGVRLPVADLMACALVGSALYGLVAWGLWRASVRRFEREKGPPAQYGREKVSAGPS